MAYWYMDTDAGLDTNDGTTWALGKLTIEGVLAVALAGDTCVIQGATIDTLATERTLTSAGTKLNPVKIIGVKDGTTNEGAAIITSDLPVIGTDTLVEIQTTAGVNIILGGAAVVSGVKFNASNNFSTPAGIPEIHWSIIDCEMILNDFLYCNSGVMYFEGGTITIAATSSTLLARNEGFVRMFGVKFIYSVVPNSIFYASIGEGFIELNSCDLSGMGDTVLATGNTSDNCGGYVLRNCILPATYTRLSGVISEFNKDDNFLTMIACNANTAAKTDTESFQDYSKDSLYGTVENEGVIVRTGGADDGATGVFSIAMTPLIDSTKEGTKAALLSPWFDVWVAAGLTTLTVYIANSEADGVDFLEDEVWCEFYTPDSADTAQHELTIFPAKERLLESSTIITDDTGSTWGAGGNNHQKFVATVTPGFEGLVQVRLNYAKRFAAAPTVLYLDPLVEVT